MKTWERLVASMLASGLKPDLRAVAGYYGCTYDTLQNRFRAIKKAAEGVKAEHTDEDGKEVTPMPGSAKATPRKPKTPKKDQLESKCMFLPEPRISLLTVCSGRQRACLEEDTKEDVYQEDHGQAREE